MMQLSCPWCGPRPEHEFHCGGTSHIVRPALACDDAQWADYLFNRANPSGAHAERWRHTFGCGQWFNMCRDTLTHDISLVYPIDAAAPSASRELP